MVKRDLGEEKKKKKIRWWVGAAFVKRHRLIAVDRGSNSRAAGAMARTLKAACRYRLIRLRHREKMILEGAWGSVGRCVDKC